MTRGDVSKSFTRLYSGEDYHGQCPDYPIHFLHWGCFLGDDREWYERTDVGDMNINGDELILGDFYVREMQQFEWSWYEEPEIRYNTNPACGDDSCSANYRIYLHPLDNTFEDWNDAFFYPPFEVKSVHAVCPPLDNEPPPVDEPPTPFPPTGPVDDIPCAAWGCRDIIFDIFTIDVPNIPAWWRYTSPPQESAVGGLAVAGIDTYGGKLAGLYRSSFEYPGDVIDTVDFSSTLGPVVGAPSSGAPAPDVEIMRNAWVFGGRNLAGYVNELWHGIPLKDSQSPGGYVYHWTKYTFPQNHVAPLPRGKAALFFDPGSGRLVLYGGKTVAGAAGGQEAALGDLWFLDTASLTWTQGQVRGEVPDGLKDFSIAQGVIRVGGAKRPFGFLWGGVDRSGALSNALYMLDLQSGEFHAYNFEGEAPPGLTGAALRFDPTSHRIHLFGGYDGQSWHNWLWTFNLQDLSWSLTADDCLEGICPYVASSSALVSYDANDKVMVIPGPDPFAGHEVRPEMYFVKSISGWQGSSQREPWMVRGDCDGDGAAEEGWGSHCSATGLWYHLPGKKTCDTLTQSLACMQDPAPAVDLYSYRIPGLKVLRPAGPVIFAAKGSWLLSLDAQDPSSLPVLDTFALDGEVRDMELWEGKLVIAQDAGLAIIDASNPANLLFEREIWTCGRASAVEVAGDTAYFLTPAGIGSVSLEDGGAALPDYFGLLLPVSWSQWEVVEVDPALCDDLSHLAGGLPWGPDRGFEAAYGRGYVAVHKDLIVIKLNDEGFEIESSLRFTSMIDFLRQEGDFVYLDLKDGSRPLVYVRDPAEPQFAGEHSVGNWAAGATGVDGKIYRMRKNFVDIASVR